LELQEKVYDQMMRKVYASNPDSTPPLLCPELKPVFLAHENQWFRVMSRGTYYTMEYARPQVAVLPIIEGSSIIMIRVKRPLIDDCPLELPAGDSLCGETPRIAAMREFVEETGIHIRDPLRFVPDLPVSEMPGRIPVLLSVFRVDLSKQEFESRLQHDIDIVSVEAISFADAAQRLVNGEIYLSSPATIISRFLLKTFIERSSAQKIGADKPDSI
jgi:8-oxo-dGTP pyrophosphatase MutT (NUDIX family)